MNWQVISEIYGEYKTWFGWFDICKNAKLCRNAIWSNCKFNQVIFFEYYNKILQIFCTLLLQQWSVCVLLHLQNLPINGKSFILPICIRIRIDLSLIHIWWMLIFLFPQDLIFKIKTIAVLATSWCRIWIWNFSLPPLVKHPLYGFFFIS